MARALFVLLIACFIPCATTFAQDNSAKTNGTIEVLSQFGGSNGSADIYGDRAYVGVGPELVIYDISGSEPIELGRSTTDGRLITAIKIQNGMAYVGTATGRFFLFYVSNMTVPFLLGSIDLHSSIMDIDASGWTAYVGTGSHGVYVLDTSRYRPEILDNFFIDNIYKVELDNDRLYVMSHSMILQIYDISTPSEPAFLGSYSECASRFFTVENSFLYLPAHSGLTILDASNPSSFEPITTFPEIKSSIVESQDNTLYFISTDAALQYDISQPATPVFTGHLQHQDRINSIAVSGDRAILLSCDGFTISNLAHGVSSILGSISLEGEINDIQCQGNTAFVLASRFYTIDIQDPENPTILFSTPLDMYNFDISISGDIACIASDMGFTIFDISSPSAPVLLSRITEYGGAAGVILEKNHAFLLTNDGLLRLDLSTPSNPQLLNVYPYYNFADEMRINNNYLYITNEGTGIDVFDISNPLITTFKGNAYSGSFIHQIDGIESDYCYIAGSNQMSLALLTSPYHFIVSEAMSFDNSIRDLEIANQYAYVSTSDAAIQIVDISNRSFTTLIQTIPTTQKALNLTYHDGLLYFRKYNEFVIRSCIEKEACYIRTTNSISDIAISDDYAYTVSHNNLFSIFDISSISAPAQIGMLPGECRGSDLHVALNGDYAHVAGLLASLRTIDISDRTNPCLTSSYTNGYFANSDIDVHEGYVYALWPSTLSETFQVLDMSDPEWLHSTGGIDLDITPYDISISGNIAGLACFRDGMCILDISNPVQPVLLSTISTMDTAKGIAVSGSYAYIANWRAGLTIYDISNPYSPSLVGNYDPPSFSCSRVTLWNQYAIASDNTTHIVDISDPSNPTRVGAFWGANQSGSAVVEDSLLFIPTMLYGVYCLQLPDVFLDEDGDGILNADDECPGSILPGEFIDDTGCLKNVSGDYDLDGDVDLADYAGFQACYGENTDNRCMFAFDKAGDGIINEDDFELFESLFTGPQQ